MVDEPGRAGIMCFEGKECRVHGEPVCVNLPDMEPRDDVLFVSSAPECMECGQFRRDSEAWGVGRMLIQLYQVST